MTEIALDGRTLTPAGVLTLAPDSLRGAMAQSASLAAARISALLDPEVTGLAPQLALEPGPDSGAMISNFAGHSAPRTSNALSRTTAPSSSAPTRSSPRSRSARRPCSGRAAGRGGA